MRPLAAPWDAASGALRAALRRQEAREWGPLRSKEAAAAGGRGSRARAWRHAARAGRASRAEVHAFCIDFYAIGRQAAGGRMGRR